MNPLTLTVAPEADLRWKVIGGKQVFVESCGEFFIEGVVEFSELAMPANKLVTIPTDVASARISVAVSHPRFPDARLGWQELHAVFDPVNGGAFEDIKRQCVLDAVTHAQTTLHRLYEDARQMVVAKRQLQPSVLLPNEI